MRSGMPIAARLGASELMREPVLDHGGGHRPEIPRCFCRLVAPHEDAVARLKLAF